MRLAAPCQCRRPSDSVDRSLFFWQTIPEDFAIVQTAALQASEAFLQRAMALFVASHYRNTPNDLVLMSDAPAHHLFALLGPVDETKVGLSSA